MAMKPLLKDVPHLVQNDNGTKSYTRGSFLGKGGFARCYHLTDTNTNVVVAGKVVSKLLLKGKTEMDKMCQEVTIHRGLSHKHIVKLIDYFEDVDNVYVILELCARRSLMELHKRRRGVTEPEARYFTYQITDAVEYIHSQNIIHRDLKLGNIFINNEMAMKIGDFGLAASVENELRLTKCGTPNYIAPEVLNRAGHSYEVDIWAIGCILYTLIVGKPPFETKALKDTYALIRANTFRIPCWVSSDARTLIAHLLAANPKHRPHTMEVRKHPFFNGFMPVRLPTSCLTMAPKFTHEQAPPGMRCGCCKPPVSTGTPTRTPAPAAAVVAEPFRPLQGVPALRSPTNKQTRVPSTSPDGLLSELHSQLSALLKARELKKHTASNDVCESPEAMPVYWISKWVDDSDYGMAYTLSDGSVGVLFNDNTKLVTDASANQLAHIDDKNKENYHTRTDFPQALDKKVKISIRFRTYMNEHLMNAAEALAPKAGDELARLPWLRNWDRNDSAVVFHLSNGTVQFNFFKDHSKLVLCPLLGAVSLITANRQMQVFKFSLIAEHGCTKGLYERLKYAGDKCAKLLKEEKQQTTKK